MTDTKETTRQSSGLLDFLVGHPQDDVTEKFIIPRIGAKLPLTVKAVTFEELEGYREEARAASRTKDGFNSRRFRELLIINHLVDPDLRDPDVLKKAGVKTSEEFLYKFFRPGEIEKIENIISTVSGYGADESAAIVEAKD